MIRLLMTLSLIGAWMVCGLPQTALAAAPDQQYSLNIYLGEAFMPSNFRVGFKSVDVGYDGRNGLLYFGGKTAKGQLYAGFGGAVGGSVGIYSLIGYQFLPLSHLAINTEFFVSGTVQGTVSGTGLLGMGVVW